MKDSSALLRTSRPRAHLQGAQKLDQRLKHRVAPWPGAAVSCQAGEPLRRGARGQVRLGLVLVQAGRGRQGNRVRRRASGRRPPFPPPESLARPGFPFDGRRRCSGPRQALLPPQGCQVPAEGLGQRVAVAVVDEQRPLARQGRVAGSMAFAAVPRCLLIWSFLPDPVEVMAVVPDCLRRQAYGLARIFSSSWSSVWPCSSRTDSSSSQGSTTRTSGPSRRGSRVL